jgi:hypothetical protein
MRGKAKAPCHWDSPETGVRGMKIASICREKWLPSTLDIVWERIGHTGQRSVN